MNTKQPLLSICIPTYNRAEYLKQALSSIVNNGSFCDDVEVVISDNCSTDNTEEICNDFIKRYPNIKYYKQQKPTYIADQNFIDVLSLATGKYIKLHNDTSFIKDKMLLKIINIIKQNINSQYPIFFYQNYHNTKNTICSSTSLDDILNKVSYFVTWISNFGCWKKDFDNLEQKDKYISMGLMQVDWTFRIILNHKKFDMFFFDFYDIAKIYKKNGGNIFKIFAYNYFIILKKYMNENLLKKETFEFEKKRILFRYLIPNYFSITYQKDFCFDTSEKIKYLIDYRGNWYFYFVICIFPILYILYGSIFLLKKLTSHNHRLYKFLKKIRKKSRI